MLGAKFETSGVLEVKLGYMLGFKALVKTPCNLQDLGMPRPGEVRQGAAERLELPVSTPVLSMGWPGRPEELCTIHSLQETGWLPTLRIEYINPASRSPLSSGVLAQENT